MLTLTLETVHSVFIYLLLLLALAEIRMFVVSSVVVLV